MSRPKLCILSLSSIHQDSRVLRQIDFAARAGYEVTVVGWGHLDKDRPNVSMHPVQRVVLSPAERAMQVIRMIGGRITPKLFEKWYWAKPDHHQALQAVIDSKPNLIHANEAIALPIAIEAAKRIGAKVLFDAHEYSPEQRADSMIWRILAQPFYNSIIRTYVLQADAIITVEPHIARRYEDEFGIIDVGVIRNVPPYQSLPFHSTDPKHVRLIHHGAAMKERRLESMIHTLALTDERFTLDFMLLPGTPGYMDRLKHVAATLVPDRIYFRPPVPPDGISSVISEYDIGIYLLNPANYNQSMALPNKFFDFIMAGLAVAIGPSPAMAALVEKYGIGIVAEDFEPASLAHKLNALSSTDIDSMKRRSLQAARELNAETEMRKLLDIYTQLLNS